MSWLYENHSYTSPQNGEILVQRRFGHWSVWVDGYRQTGHIVNEIWKDALLRIQYSLPQQKPHVLLLGLGGGGAVKEIYSLFPGCHITAVEHDGIMIQIAKDFRLYDPAHLATILQGDAAHIVPLLTGSFDLILVDLFQGNKPALALQNPEFFTHLRNRLSPGGFVLVNGCGSTGILDTAEKIFPKHKRWKYRANWLGSFSVNKR